MKRFASMFDEEQERELEQELEEECHVERPPPIQPAISYISEGLKQLSTALKGDKVCQRFRVLINI